MDCRRCVWMRYEGCPHCSHVGHLDVRFDKRSNTVDGVRPYSRDICPDYRLKRRCSNCAQWIRGEYFADGSTPSRHGRCGLGRVDIAEECPYWERGKTSWRKRTAVKSASIS